MQPITVRKVTNFDITSTLSITKNNSNFGIITPMSNSEDKVLQGGQIFHSFTGTLFNQIEDDIDVEIDNQIHHVTSYQRPESFTIFYSETSHLLLIFAGTRQSKIFIDQLQKNYADKVSVNSIDFDFTNISSDSVNNKALFFNVDDSHLDSMAAFGDEVEQNSSVSSAIDGRRATYLMAQMDIGGTSYTLGFSKKSALVIYQKLNETGTDNPYLQLAMDILNTIHALN